MSMKEPDKLQGSYIKNEDKSGRTSPFDAGPLGQPPALEGSVKLSGLCTYQTRFVPKIDTKFILQARDSHQSEMCA